MTLGPVPAGVADAAALASIHAAAFPPKEAWSATVIALQIETPGSFALLDTRGGMILARAIADEAEVVTIAVRPSARRRGVAHGLLAAAMEMARQNGAVAMFLEVDVENAPARALYGAAGFRQVGRRRRYYSNGSDALILRAWLTPDGGAPDDGE